MCGKVLLINYDIEETLTFEEVLEKYKALINKSIQPWFYTFEKEDLMQIASMGLWRAYKNYDIEKYRVAFGYYAGLVIQNYFKVNYRNYMKSVNDTVSLNDEAPTEDKNLEYIDILEDNRYNLESDILSRLGLKEAINSLKENERIYLILSLNGMEQRDIAKKFNTLQPSVSRVIKRAKEKVRMGLEV